MSVKSITLAALLACASLSPQASIAGKTAPFAPPSAPKPKVVRLLAFAGFFEPSVFERFERATGYAVAYDTYSLSLEIPERWKDGPYDVVVMPGPALARRIAAAALARFDRRRLANARAIQSPIDAKLSAYDPGDAYSAPSGWAPYGLVYNAGKAPARLGGPPTTWSALLDPRISRKLSDCGIATPNARDAMFVAAWRLAGVDPSRARPIDIKAAAALIGRAKPAMQGFALADPVGSIARGRICLTVGTPGEAAAANARAKSIGVKGEIGFAEPKEGGGIEIDAFAIPRDAPNPDMAYKLIDFLLTPEVAQQNARFAGVFPSSEAPDADMAKRLWPLGAFDDSFTQAMEAEWTRLRTSK